MEALIIFTSPIFAILIVAALAHEYFATKKPSDYEVWLRQDRERWPELYKDEEPHHD